jgi:hypothetical protein
MLCLITEIHTSLLLIYLKSILILESTELSQNKEFVLLKLAVEGKKNNKKVVSKCWIEALKILIRSKKFNTYVII